MNRAQMKVVLGLLPFIPIAILVAPSSDPNYGNLFYFLLADAVVSSILSLHACMNRRVGRWPVRLLWVLVIWAAPLGQFIYWWFQVWREPAPISST